MLLVITAYTYPVVSGEIKETVGVFHLSGGHSHCTPLSGCFLICRG